MHEMPPAERALSVSSREGKGREVEIFVTDSGPGIAQEMTDQLFEPFATTKKEGLGLGLSISRTIVQAHNGHLSVRNGSDGGATFRSDERRVGKECVSTCSSRGSPDP